MQLTGRTVLRHLVAALVAGLAVGPMLSAAAADPSLLEALNAARSAGCSGRAGAGVALRESSRLSDATRQLAQGTPYKDALAMNGYRAMRSATIRLRGDPAPQVVVDAVVKTSCAQLADTELREVGIYQEGRETWMLLAAPFAPPAPEDAPTIALRVLELVNQARGVSRLCGNRPLAATGELQLNATLSGVAYDHARDMAQNEYFAHEGRDGSTPAVRATRAGYKWQMVAENIAFGVMTPEAAVEGWLKSPPHCTALMAPQFTEMGVAFAVNPSSDAGIYWGQMFGTPRQ